MKKSLQGPKIGPKSDPIEAKMLIQIHSDPIKLNLIESIQICDFLNEIVVEKTQNQTQNRTQLNLI